MIDREGDVVQDGFTVEGDGHAFEDDDRLLLAGSSRLKILMDELFGQTKNVFVNSDYEPEVFSKRIAFNVIPQIDVFMEDNMTKEEWKMMVETRKIMEADIKVCANCVRVPVFIGHAAMVNCEMENELAADDAKRLLRASPGITLIDVESDMQYITPQEIQGEDNVFVSRVRDDITVENGLNFWCVADNLRKGAALNAIQIAEVLVRDHLRKAA